MAGINLMDRHMAIAASPHIENQNGSITFTKKALAMPVKKMLVDIESVQSGSGDPSPTNVRPISGWTGAKVSRTGENLFDMHIASGEDYKTIVLDKPLYGTISVSVQNNNVVLSEAVWRIKFMHKNGDLYYVYDAGAPNNPTPHTFTVQSGNPITEITYRSVTMSSGSYDFCIKHGSDTAYEPYTGTTYPISWQSEAGTVYGGTLDVTTGLLTVDRGMVDLGTLNWRRNGQTVQFFSDPIANAVNDYMGRNVICSCYTGGNAYNPTVNYLICIAEPLHRAFVTDDRYTDGIALKNALSGAQLVYELATPQTYQLTPTEVKLLLGDNNVWADMGDITMKFWSH